MGENETTRGQSQGTDEGTALIGEHAQSTEGSAARAREISELDEEAKAIIVDTGAAILEKVFEKFPSRSKEDVLSLVNTALFFVSCIQNTFYSYEDRDKFADLFAFYLKQNKWKDEEMKAAMDLKGPESASISKTT